MQHEESQTGQVVTEVNKGRAAEDYAIAAHRTLVAFDSTAINLNDAASQLLKLKRTVKALSGSLFYMPVKRLSHVSWSALAHVVKSGQSAEIVTSNGAYDSTVRVLVCKPPAHDIDYYIAAGGDLRVDGSMEFIFNEDGWLVMSASFNTVFFCDDEYKVALVSLVKDREAAKLKDNEAAQ